MNYVARTVAAGNGRRILNVEPFLNTLRFQFGGYRFRLSDGVDFLSLSGRSRYFPAIGSPRLNATIQRLSDACPLPFRGLIALEPEHVVRGDARLPDLTGSAEYPRSGAQMPCVLEALTR